MISYYDRDPEVVLTELLDFAEVTTKFNDSNIYEFLSFMRFRNDQEHQVEIIEQQLNWLVEMFFLAQKDEGKLLRYKKDYL